MRTLSRRTSSLCLRRTSLAVPCRKWTPSLEIRRSFGTRTTRVILGATPRLLLWHKAYGCLALPPRGRRCSFMHVVFSNQQGAWPWFYLLSY